MDVTRGRLIGRLEKFQDYLMCRQKYGDEFSVAFSLLRAQEAIRQVIMISDELWDEFMKSQEVRADTQTETKQI